jgi:hypothetical protein
MHRSGTSAANRVINLLGVPVNVPGDWLAPTAHNPKGFWESSSLVAVNDELLALLGCDCWCPPVLPSAWERDEYLQEFGQRAVSAFRAVFRTPQWTWKDPRNCVTFPFWAHVLDLRPVVVSVYRNPLEVSRSVMAATALSASLSRLHTLAIWERYVRASLVNAAGMPVLVTNYADLLEDPHSWCARTHAFLASHGVALNEKDSMAEISAFLEKELRHSRFTLDDLRHDPDLSESQVELFALLEASRGIYERFRVPHLPPETPWTETLLAERRRSVAHEPPAACRPHVLSVSGGRT